ncbi:MAG: DMT family transporter, partial [Muribaculaceae bacterium]|nr:DMT family transporter [Muribaculaceae bacterium]
LLFWIAWLVFPRTVVPHEHVQRGDWMKFALAGLLMISANQGLFTLGIGYTSPIDSSVMSTLTPIVTMVLAAIFIGMPVTWLKAGGVALGLTGALMMILGSHGGTDLAPNPVLGDMLCLGAQICAAVYYVSFMNVIRRYSPFTMMKWMFTFAAVTYVPCTLPWLLDVDFGAVSMTSWYEVGYVVVFATFLSYIAIPYAQHYLKPTVMAMYNYLQPAAAAGLAAMLGTGAFGVLKIVAAGLIFAGVWVVTQSRGHENGVKA